MNRPNRSRVNYSGNRQHMPYRHHPYSARPNFITETSFVPNYEYNNPLHVQPSLEHGYEGHENQSNYEYNIETGIPTESSHSNVAPQPISTGNETLSNLDAPTQWSSYFDDQPQQSSFYASSVNSYYQNPDSFGQMKPSIGDNSNLKKVYWEQNSKSGEDLTQTESSTKSAYVPVPITRPLPVTLDPSLPPEVAKLMENRLCKLCSVKLNSRVQAKTHYEGKPHAKKLKASVELFQQQGKVSANGEPPTKKKRISMEDASQLYCKCCDLSFTSTEHAKQHYLGRNHYRVLNGLKPLKTGYYNKTTGKWQRMPPDPTVSAEMLNSDSNSIDESIQGKGMFFCDVCGVSATSKEQLDDHIKGIRHKKSVQSSATPPVEKLRTNSADSILASVMKSDRTKNHKEKDYSIYRTPSGKYYCGPCDITLNSETQFAKHVDSKKHKFKKK